jgi:hypothetical protein
MPTRYNSPIRYNDPVEYDGIRYFGQPRVTITERETSAAQTTVTAAPVDVQESEIRTVRETDADR